MTLLVCGPATWLKMWLDLGPHLGADLMAVFRPANTATPQQMTKVPRAGLDRPPDMKHLMHSDPEVVMKATPEFPQLLQDILMCTPRPTPSLLEKAAVSAWDMSKSEAEAFAQRACSCISHCRLKHKSSTSGAKLSAAVKVVAEAFKAQGAGAALLQGTGKLQARVLPSAPKFPAKPALPLQRGPESSASSSVPALIPESPPRRPSSSTTLKGLLTREELFKSLGLQLEAAAPSPVSAVSPKSLVDLCSPAPSAGSVPTNTPAPKRRLSTKTPEAPVDTSAAQYIDSTRRAVVRQTAAGLVVAKMSEGPGAFALAQFGDEEPFESEIPNLFLLAKADPSAPSYKRPAAAAGKRIKKRPAAKKKQQKRKRPRPEVEFEDEEAEEAEPEEDLEEDLVGDQGEEQEEDQEEQEEAAEAPGSSAPLRPLAVVEEQDWKLMPYATNGAIAIRQTKGAKRQIFQLAAKALSQQQLKDLAEQCLPRLRAGEAEVAVKLWAYGELDRMKQQA